MDTWRWIPKANGTGEKSKSVRVVKKLKQQRVANMDMLLLLVLLPQGRARRRTIKSILVIP
jgi:hypothetical protein